jgi:hypothetical protein
MKSWTGIRVPYFWASIWSTSRVLKVPYQYAFTLLCKSVMAYKTKSTLSMITMSYSLTQRCPSMVQMTHAPYDVADLSDSRIVADCLQSCISPRSDQSGQWSPSFGRLSSTHPRCNYHMSVRNPRGGQLRRKTRKCRWVTDPIISLPRL